MIYQGRWHSSPVGCVRPFCPAGFVVTCCLVDVVREVEERSQTVPQSRRAGRVRGDQSGGDEKGLLGKRF